MAIAGSLRAQSTEAKIAETSALVISGARTKLNGDGKILDAKTLASVKLLIKSLLENIDRKLKSRRECRRKFEKK